MIMMMIVTILMMDDDDNDDGSNDNESDDDIGIMEMMMIFFNGCIYLYLFIQGYEVSAMKSIQVPFMGFEHCTRHYIGF